MVNRYFTGYGQEHGGLAIEIHNHNERDIEALLLDTLPWFLKLYLHTFSVEVDGRSLENQKGKASATATRINCPKGDSSNQLSLP